MRLTSETPYDSEAASLCECHNGGVLLMATVFSLQPSPLKLDTNGGYQEP